MSSASRARLGRQVGAQLLGVGDGPLHDLLALAAALAQQLLVLGEQGLGLRARALGALHGVADALLPLLDHGEERVPGQLRHHEGEDREEDRASPRRA